MDESAALERMVPPSKARQGIWLGGIMQIHVTRACDKACYGCTQGSNLGGKTTFMLPEQFEVACQSLRDYFGVVAIFGGNPCISPHFESYCKILRKYFPQRQCGLWSNHPLGKGKICRTTFNPHHSNLNVHLDQAAYDEFKRDWPESRPFGLDQDSRHSPPWIALRDVIPDGPISAEIIHYLQERNIPVALDANGQPDGKRTRWQMIGNCDINQRWSALIGVFRGQVRAYFCEIAYAQSALHQDNPDYPDTGIALPLPAASTPWWTWPMHYFRDQVNKHCHDCGVPLRGYGELACASDHEGVEQVSVTHQSIFKTKRKGRKVEVVTQLEQLGMGRLKRMTDYVPNGKL